MAFNPEDGVVVGGFDPNAGTVIDAPQATRQKAPRDASAPIGRHSSIPPMSSRADSTIQQTAPGQFSGEARVTADPAWADVISPANAQAQREGQGWLGKEYASGKDFLTALPRAAFAGFQGAATLAGSGDLGEALAQAKIAAANPTASFEADAPSMGALQKNVASLQQFAAMAGDPLAIPLAYIGGSEAKPLAQGLLGSVLSYAKRQVDAKARGEETQNGLTDGEYIPAALGAAVSAFPIVGGRIQAGANYLFRKAVKPVTKEVEGLTDALEKGKLPELAGWSGTVGGSGEQFIKSLGEQGAQYPKILAVADATGNKVSTFQAVNAAKQSVAKAMADRQLAASIPEGISAVDWLRGKVQIPTTEKEILQALSGRSVPANDILPSQAHPIKSSLYDAAFDQTQSTLVPKAAKIMAAKGAARDLRAQLGEISPEYAAFNREMAPLYGAEDAMARAAAVRGNNYNFNGLDLMGLGIPIALRTPAILRAIFESGKLAGDLAPLAKRIAPVIASPSDQTKLGKRKSNER